MARGYLRKRGDRSWQFRARRPQGLPPVVRNRQGNKRQAEALTLSGLRTQQPNGEWSRANA